MKAPINNDDYPQYFRSEHKLLAFISKDKMYKIEPIGSNMNPGITVDYYVTRNMVLKHWTARGLKISKTDFKILLTKVYSNYIDKICPE